MHGSRSVWTRYRFCRSCCWPVVSARPAFSTIYAVPLSIQNILNFFAWYACLYVISFYFISLKVFVTYSHYPRLSSLDLLTFSSVAFSVANMQAYSHLPLTSIPFSHIPYSFAVFVFSVYANFRAAQLSGTCAARREAFSWSWTVPLFLQVDQRHQFASLVQSENVETGCLTLNV